jgi:hypothetical protein
MQRVEEQGGRRRRLRSIKIAQCGGVDDKGGSEGGLAAWKFRGGGLEAWRLGGSEARTVEWGRRAEKGGGRIRGEGRVNG